MNTALNHRAKQLLFAFALITLSFSSSARAEVGDPTLRTDHPIYAGEGAFQTVEDCVRFATEGKTTAQDKAIALYLWILTHQFHLASPQEQFVPGTIPDSAKGTQDNIVYDANRSRFSYGYGLCGTVHAWNEVYWRSLGMNSRRRAFPGHTNSEVQYDGSWHTFDTDMAGLVFRRDGVVAGYEDIMKDVTLANLPRAPLPCYPFAWPADFQGMKNGWQQVARGGNWFKMYYAGYAAQPGVVHLRSGESFTRWFDRDHFGGAAKRRFWQNQKGGPFRDWTFVNTGDTAHEQNKSNSRGNASYCNGEFVYRPDLTGDKYREGIAAQSPNVAARSTSPHLYSRDGQPTSVTFAHFSPYVICGDPADDANPMTAAASDGLVITGRAVGQVQLEISADQGQSWKSVGPVTGEFRHDLTNEVKGRYGWQAQFRFAGQAGLDEVTFTTTTQVSQVIYPRLSAGGCDVTYRAASRAVAPVLPNFGLSEAELASIEVTALRSANVQYSPRGPQSAQAYKVTNNKAGTVVFRVASPRPLLAVSAAARFGVRVPTPDGCDFHLDVSTDAGQSWRQFGRSDPPSDNEYSSGWVYGQTDLAGTDTREALVRVNLYQGGYQGRLIDAQLYGLYRTAAPQALTVTYGWKEAAQAKTHRVEIPSGAAEHRFHVPTGEKIVDDFVRLEAP